MTVGRSRPRLALALVGLVAAALLAARLIAGGGDGAPARASTADPHAIPHYAPGELHRLLAATEAASTSSSQAELVSRGRALFLVTSAPAKGEPWGSGPTTRQ